MSRILIVDDIHVNRLLLKEILTKISVDCLEAKDGKEALEILQNEKVDNPADFFEDFYNTGFNYLLTKPYSIERIQKAIDETLKQEKQQNWIFKFQY